MQRSFGFDPLVCHACGARLRLLARLDAGLHGALTLICAPAGFGKSTLLAEWLRHTGRPTAWLGLDARDNDPATFLRYLVAALQTLAPEVGAALPALLQSPAPPPLEVLLTSLLNDLALLLADVLDQVQNQMGGSGGGSGQPMPQMGQQMQRMGQQQQQLNERIQEFLNQAAGRRLSPEQQGQAERLAGQQDQLRRQLEELARENAGRLDTRTVGTVTTLRTG